MDSGLSGELGPLECMLSVAGGGEWSTGDVLGFVLALLLFVRGLSEASAEGGQRACCYDC